MNKDLEKILETKFEIDVLNQLQKILEDFKRVGNHITYKKGKGYYEWDLYLNGEYFQTMIASDFNNVELVVKSIESAYFNGINDTIKKVLQLF